MSFDFHLFNSIRFLPKETKEELRSINEESYKGRGSGAINAKIIYDWLVKHGYKEPEDEDFSLSRIKDFINPNKHFEEYYPERIPEQQDDEEELKQLEMRLIKE